MTFRLPANNGPNIEYWLGSFASFKGIWTIIAKEQDSFVIFQVGLNPLSSFPIDPRMNGYHEYITIRNHY